MAVDTPTVKEMNAQMTITHSVPTIAGNSPDCTALLDGASVSSVLMDAPSRLNHAQASVSTL